MLEEEEWVYLTPADPNPHLRSRVASVKRGPQAAPIIESWIYGTTPWPISHTSLSGVTTTYTYDSGGQVLEETIGSVNAISAKDPAYSIKTKTEYDSRGRVDRQWSPDRLHYFGEASFPSVCYEYYQSGLNDGFLQRKSHHQETGTKLLWAEYEFDIFGNITRANEPVGTTGTRVTTHEYDPQDRIIKSTGPNVTLTSTPSSTVYDETTFEYSGDDLVREWRKYWDETGVAGTGAEGSSPSPTRVLAREREFDSRGRLVGTKSEFDFDPSVGTSRYAETRLSYCPRGSVVKTERRLDGANWVEQRTEYDERGLVLRNVSVPGAPASELSSWYAYDHRHRRIETFNPNWQEPNQTTYDAYGRVERTVSTRTNMGNNGTSDVHGYIEKVSQYHTGTYLTRSEERRYHEDTYVLGAGSQMSFVEYAYDEAARRVQTKTLTKTSPAQYSYHSVDLHPGGSPKRTFAQAATQIFDYYIYNVIDGFGRIVETRDCYQADAPAYRNKRTFTYEAPSGALLSS